MSNISNKEVLEFLHAEKDDLEYKLERIEKAIEICNHQYARDYFSKSEKEKPEVLIKPSVPLENSKIETRGMKKKEFLPYEEARNFVRGLKLQSLVDWRKYIIGKFPDLPEKPEDIPSTPHIVYRDKGWVDWYDFTGKVKKKDLPEIPKKENASQKIDVVLAAEAEMEENQKKSEKKLKANSPHF